MESLMDMYGNNNNNTIISEKELNNPNFSSKSSISINPNSIKYYSYSSESFNLSYKSGLTGFMDEKSYGK